jgi:hypothetical protein
METLMTDMTWTTITVVVVVALIGIGAWYFYQKKRSQSLQKHFGPEYDRTVTELGSRAKGESELKAREKRVERLELIPLAAPEAARFSEAWQALQSRFVDNPKGVVVQAEQLVRELMTKRGYPMGDFEQRAGDISVDHPDVVANYRAAQAIAVRDQRGSADTEELRKAVVHYRALFDELLEVREPRQESVADKRVA